MSRYSMIIQWSDEDQLFLVTIPEFGDRVVMPCTHGKTREEAIRNVESPRRESWRGFWAWRRARNWRSDPLAIPLALKRLAAFRPTRLGMGHPAVFR